jgi:hypothetical protein
MPACSVYIELLLWNIIHKGTPIQVSTIRAATSMLCMYLLAVFTVSALVKTASRTITNPRIIE